MESISLTKASPNLNVGNLNLGKVLSAQSKGRQFKFGETSPNFQIIFFSSLQNSECYSGNICPWALPPGGFVSPSGGFASLLFDQGVP